MKDLGIAYAMRKRAAKRKLAQGGLIEPDPMHAPEHALDEELSPMEPIHHDMPDLMEEDHEPKMKKRGLMDAIMHKVRSKHMGK